jgi:hypothetical protein
MVLLSRCRAGLTLALVFAAGCAMPRQQAPEVDPSTLGDVEFQAYLADAPFVTVDEAFRALLILADGEDTSKSFEERRQKLESRGIARPQWKLEPNNLIDKGSVAYMICRICRIRGGINLMVFGAIGLGDRHYALRELVYDNIAEETSEFSFVRGGEMISLMSKADEYMRKHKVYEGTPIELPPEPEGGAIPQWAEESAGGGAAPAEAGGSSPAPDAQPEPPDAGQPDVGNTQVVPPSGG